MKICIDAGHNYSGHDTGVSANGLKEQNVTYFIAERLKDALVSNGHNVVMTRDKLEDNLGTDVNSSLRTRAAISNNNSCDLFISLHCNSASPAAGGTETLISSRGGQTEKYAEKVQNSICEKLDMINRGVRVDTEYLNKSLYVLHNTISPAILIELGFLTNADDAEKLKYNAENFAFAIAQAIDEVSSPALKDIKGHWAQHHIEKLLDYGVINGYEDGNFYPDKNVTRAEVATIVSNALSVLGK